MLFSDIFKVRYAEKAAAETFASKYSYEIGKISILLSTLV